MKSVGQSDRFVLFDLIFFDLILFYYFVLFFLFCYYKVKDGVLLEDVSSGVTNIASKV